MTEEQSHGVSENEGRLGQWIESIQARSDDLAASEEKVVALLFADPLFDGASTTAQVASRAGVSAPTVIRAARAIGFTGFTELEIARARGTTRFFATPEVLSADATLVTLLETSIRAGTDALTALGGAVELAALDDAVFRFRAVGVTTISIPDHLSAIIAMRLLSPGDVVIAVSSTGRTSTTLALADAAFSAGATLIAVTSRYSTPLATLANIVLVVGGASLPTQMAAVGSRLARLVVVVDVLVAALALRDPERSRRAERASIDLPDIS